MNKDALLATIIGFGVGLVIAGLVFLGPSMIKSLPRVSFPNISQFISSLSKKTISKPKTPTKTTTTLTIESPLADSIEQKNETLLSGKTFPNATVVLEGENNEMVVIANQQGAYAGKLILGEGKNDLKVTSYTHNGKETQTQTVRVFYTPENF